MRSPANLRPCNDDDGTPVSFETLMALEIIENQSTKYRSTTKAFQPGAPMFEVKDFPRAYGGHVFAQAMWAAAQTVSSGFLVHSVSGHYISMGSVERPFYYSVRNLRDGRSYCTRAVDAMQDGIKGVIYTCTCSFKKQEPTPFEFQERTDLNAKYAIVLSGKRPEDHPSALSIESPWFMDSPEARRRATPFPGLKTHKVLMREYNRGRPALDGRALTYYATIGDMPSVSASPNLHACAHLYASDRNSLFGASNILNLDRDWTMMASLSQTVVFHTSADALSMTSPNASGSGTEASSKWFLQEAWTDRLADGRIMHHSKIWDGNNRHVATTMQDGLMRMKFDSEEELRSTKREVEAGRPKI